jgi:hypothetical protein
MKKIILVIFVIGLMGCGEGKIDFSVPKSTNANEKQRPDLREEWAKIPLKDAKENLIKGLEYTIENNIPYNSSLSNKELIFTIVAEKKGIKIPNEFIVCAPDDLGSRLGTEGFNWATKYIAWLKTVKE